MVQRLNGSLTFKTALLLYGLQGQTSHRRQYNQRRVQEGTQIPVQLQGRIHTSLPPQELLWSRTREMGVSDLASTLQEIAQLTISEEKNHGVCSFSTAWT